MKIIFLIHKQQARGQEIFASQLAQELTTQGLEVKLVCLYSGLFDLPFEGEIQSLGLKSSKAVWNPKKWKEFAKIVSAFDAEIIQANGGDTFKFLALASLFFIKKPKLIFNNGGVMSYYLRNYFQKKLNSFFLSRMNGLVSVSQYSKSDIEKAFSPKLPHQVITIGICIPEVQSEDQQEFTWLHIGGFTHEKNHFRLIEIFQKALNLGVGGHFQLVGDGPLMHEIERMVREKNLQSQISFQGAVPAPWHSVSIPTVLLLPSLIEGIPAVISEALCLGIPIISYGVGGIQELKKEFPSLILINPNDDGGFIEAMNSVYSNYEEYSRMSKKDIEKAKAFFSLKKKAFEFLNFYSRV